MAAKPIYPSLMTVAVMRFVLAIMATADRAVTTSLAHPHYHTSEQVVSEREPMTRRGRTCRRLGWAAPQ